MTANDDIDAGNTSVKLKIACPSLVGQGENAFNPRIFERGVSVGGTGYEMYLCKTVVESHGGKIWIESTSGNGTTVYYTLPYYEGQLGDRQI